VSRVLCTAAPRVCRSSCCWPTLDQGNQHSFLQQQQQQQDVSVKHGVQMNCTIISKRRVLIVTITAVLLFINTFSYSAELQALCLRQQLRTLQCPAVAIKELMPQ
jgi:hypothetical protein